MMILCREEVKKWMRNSLAIGSMKSASMQTPVSAH